MLFHARSLYTRYDYRLSSQNKRRERETHTELDRERERDRAGGVGVVVDCRVRRIRRYNESGNA